MPEKLSAEDARTILDTLRSLYTKKQEIDADLAIRIMEEEQKENKQK